MVFGLVPAEQNERDAGDEGQDLEEQSELREEDRRGVDHRAHGLEVRVGFAAIIDGLPERLFERRCTLRDAEQGEARAGQGE